MAASPPPPPLNHHLHSSSTPNHTLLTNCKTMKEFKQIHSRMIRTALPHSAAEHRLMLSFCCSLDSGDIDYARLLFDKIPQPDVFIWNTLIKGYSDRKRPEPAMLVYIEMLSRGFQPNDYTFPFLLKSFTRDTAIVCGDELHAHTLKFGLGSNTFVRNALLHMYALSGENEVARVLFDRSTVQDAVMWNAMISGYNRSKQYGESRKLFIEMERMNVKPNSITLVSVLLACAKLKDLDLGRKTHRMIDDSQITYNLSVENALIDMYVGCGEMDMALRIFESMQAKDVISGTAMVTGFANSGQVDCARTFFDRMPERDFIAWTAMINSYVRVSRFREALDIFREMQAARIRPDKFTMVSILTACAQLGALGIGEWVRAYMDRWKMKTDVTVENALIDMYSKCGCVESAAEIFGKMQQRDKFTWTAMITGFAVNGHGEEALKVFSQMLKASVKPDEITYIGVLSACTHTGMVEKGRELFSTMITTHGIMPTVTHYGCLVDLLGRAGHLEEALQTITNMPMKPNSAVWGTLLSACRVHKDVRMAELAAERLLELEPDNSAVYVLLSNLYTKCGKWEQVHNLRGLMMERGIKKVPGCSLIEMHGIVHEFVAGDRSHRRSNEIYAKLEEMCGELRLAGYVPDISGVFPSVSEEERENSVYRHSEKLAVAFGLLSSEPGTTIRVVKNLRMCLDCHSAIKFVSKVYRRDVVVRDRTRFHHFRQGQCSCKEYW